MYKFAANLSMLFNEVDFIERFELATKQGFKGVEYMSPYAYPKEQIAELLQKFQLKQVLFNMPAGNREKGDRGIACQPSRIGQFQESVDVALEYAAALNCQTINCLAGIMEPGVSFDDHHKTYVANLAYCAKKAQVAGINIVIEPLNPVDFPGFFLLRTDQAAAIVDEVSAFNLGIEYDVYQAQMSEGNLVNTIRQFLPKIWHMQIADVPSRAEPGTGEIRFEYLFSELKKMNYSHWIGCDYHPSCANHFDWMDKLSEKL
jgi:hydroxypyruvate isomerase